MPPRQRPSGEHPKIDKARLAAIFGDVLPETTADERDPDAGRGGPDTGSDTWLREQVPPHHG